MSNRDQKKGLERFVSQQYEYSITFNCTLKIVKMENFLCYMFFITIKKAKLILKNKQTNKQKKPCIDFVMQKGEVKIKRKRKEK